MKEKEKTDCKDVTYNTMILKTKIWFKYVPERYSKCWAVIFRWKNIGYYFSSVFLYGSVLR